MLLILVQGVRGHGGGRAPLLDQEADDHHGAANQVQVQEERRVLREARGDHDADPQEDQPRQTEHQRQDVSQHQTDVTLKCDIKIHTQRFISYERGFPCICIFFVTSFVIRHFRHFSSRSNLELGV